MRTRSRSSSKHAKRSGAVQGIDIKVPSRGAKAVKHAFVALAESLWVPGDALHVRLHPSRGAVVTLTPEAFQAWCPDFDTTTLSARLPSIASHESRDPHTMLQREALVAMLAAPLALEHASVEALASSLRVRAHTALDASKTALAFKTAAAERPTAYWHHDASTGFVLKPDAPLIDGLMAATQPEFTGRVYDFSCYRATEYVMLLAIARELHAHHGAMFERLQQLCQRRVIRSGQFHDVFLTEWGGHTQPIASRYYVPGDRVWFRNPDPVSADVSGYEGSWIIYLGGGLFGNFWKRDEPYTLDAKCLEVHHWRNGVFVDPMGEPRVNELRVDLQCEITRRQPDRHAQILERMQRPRDRKGVHARGGCIDVSREFSKSVWPGACELVLPT